MIISVAIISYGDGGGDRGLLPIAAKSLDVLYDRLLDYVYEQISARDKEDREFFLNIVEYEDEEGIGGRRRQRETAKDKVMSYFGYVSDELEIFDVVYV